jgi:CHRD domain-containing protein
MKRLKLALIALAVVVAAVATAGAMATRSGKLEDRATGLRTYEEVPALSVPTANGDLRIRIEDSNQTILFLLQWGGLSGPPLFAHIHFGQRGVNGGVAAFLCGGSTKPACPQATSGQVFGTITPTDVIGPTGQGIAPGEWGELVAAIRAGVAYGNIHTPINPGGEVRGQFPGAS